MIVISIGVVGWDDLGVNIPAPTDWLGLTPIIKAYVGIDTNRFGKPVRVIEVTNSMPQEYVRGVEGGIDPARLSGGKDDMETQIVNVEGKEGPISPRVEVVLFPDML